MRIKITAELDGESEYADEAHEIGLTEAGYELLLGKLTSMGFDDVEIVRD